MAKSSSEFAMKDLGPLSYFSQNSTGLFLSQHKYAIEIFDKASMSQYKPALTPATTSSKLCTDADSPCDDPTLYHSLAGALQYLTFTRPDISYAVQQSLSF